MKVIRSAWDKLRGHFREYVARYAVLAIAVLTPASALLGELAGDLGGVDTSVGRAILAVASALGTAAAGVVFIRNLGIWQMLDTFGTAPGAVPVPDPDATVQAEGQEPGDPPLAPGSSSFG